MHHDVHANDDWWTWSAKHGSSRLPPTSPYLIAHQDGHRAQNVELSCGVMMLSNMQHTLYESEVQRTHNVLVTVQQTHPSTGILQALWAPRKTILAVYSCSIDNRGYLQLPNHLFPRTIVHAGLCYTRSLLDQTIGMVYEPFNTLTTSQPPTQRYITKTRLYSTLKQTVLLSTKLITDRSSLRDQD